MYRFPAAVDSGKAIAAYQNGELTITCPKLVQCEVGTVKVDVTY